jgi:multiple sugar transport system permease protein
MPGALLFIPLYQLLTDLQLIDSLWSLVATYPTFTLPFATWLLMEYFKSIPPELEEVAMVDGCSRFGMQSMIFGDLVRQGQLAAASLLISIPVVLMYAFGQRSLPRGYRRRGEGLAK